jgi:uncharacterized protein
MAQKIIDMRSRPSFLHDFYGATPGTNEFEVVKWLNRRVGAKDEMHFTKSGDVKAFVKEVEAAGISSAVVVGRDTPGIKHSNDDIKKLVSASKTLVGIGSVDPHASGVKVATDEIERAVKTLGLKGINIEPGFCNPAVAADDAQLYPVYEACQALGVPVCIMSGPTTPRFELTDPAPVGRVARAFPQLKIVCYHGFYPYVNQMVGIAFRYDNVFVVADMYIFMPGGGLYVEAANGFMQDQLLFGSSYPFRPMAQSVEDYQKLGFTDAVIDKVMGGNAARVLGL